MASESTSRASNFSRLSRRFQHMVDTVTPEPASPDAPEDTGETAISQNDPLWTDYVKRAASFDQRIIDDWNKILDVTLIFVGLFISTLASFIVNAPQQFKPGPADISNQLLAAIYNKLANNSIAGSNNTIAGTNYTDTEALIQQPLGSHELHHVLVCNALLYSSLGLCCVASMFALAAKLWLISYDHWRAESSFGTPRERAMERQKAYSGVLVWKMGAVIKSLPLILLIAVGIFEFYVHQSISSIKVEEASYLGYAIGTLLSVTVMALGITSLAAAFIPACPFSTPLSTIIQLLHVNFREYVRNKLNNRKPWDKVVPIGILILLWFGSVSAIGWATIHESSSYISFICIPITITFAVATEWETNHKPQKYILPVLSLWTFVAVGSIQAAAAYFPQTDPQKFIGLYAGGMFILFIFGVLAGQLSKSMEETAEIDAITWLLTESESTPSQLFKEATGQILKNPVGIQFQPRLMNSLVPFLSPLIISYSNLETQTLDLETQMHDLETQTHDLEIYVRCLADLSKFEDVDGSYRVLKEDARSHPKLRKKLIASLKNIRKNHPSTPLGAAADEILAYYGENGRKRSSTCKFYKRQISGDSASMMTVVDSGPVQVHAYEEMELHSRLGHKNGYCRVDV